MTDTKMQLEDWLDDLCVRFIVNLPKEELESVERICFQVEEAQWFYEDFIRPLDPNLPSLNLRQFCLRIFQHCPLLSGFSPYHHSTAFSEFLAYKTRVPVRGAIMLNETMDEVVLVKGWKKNANWSFPRGKINKDEKDLDCAIREVYEETGFDIHAAELFGSEEEVKFIEVTMREQHMRLYVFRGVPMNTNFEPRTRKEISKIQWYKLSELPTLKKTKQQQQEGRLDDLAMNANKFYMVAPFLNPLKKWINQQKKLDAMSLHKQNAASLGTAATITLMRDESSSNIIINEPPTDDMSRLMTQLRQSSKPNTVNDLAELSGPESANEALSQLKSLLSVPSAEPNNSNNVQKPSDPREEKANAMLSLLRAGTMAFPPQSSQIPQTPFEQVAETAQTPLFSKNQSTSTPQISHHPSPPTFPFPQSHVIPHAINQSNRKASKSVAASGLVPLQPVQQIPQPRSPTNNFLPSEISQEGPHTMAPYQRTGDLQFTQGADPSLNSLSAISFAKSPPPPKLNTHSSTLLNIFKSGSELQTKNSVPPIHADAVMQRPLNPQKPVHFMSSMNPTESFSEKIVQLHKPQGGQLPSTILQSPPTAKSIEPLQPRSYHQETLLSLFRTPPTLVGLQVHTSSPSLAPPTTLVELAAQPSPGHSRESSEIKEPVKDRLVNGHVTIKKRPEHIPKSDQAPVSATVTGPLHFPQFDKILKRPAEKISGGVNGFAKKPHIVPSSPPQPLSILPRPSADDRTMLASQVVKNNAPKEPFQDTVREPLNNVGEIVDHKEQAKPFHPQILRRPIEPPADNISSPSPMPLIVPTAVPTPITKNNFLLDRRTSQTQEQKNALLSLFGKPQLNLASSTLTNLTLVSPALAKPSRLDSALSSPLDMPRSRIGSLNLTVGEERQTSKPSPIDKQFLLGFLAGVAEEAV